MFWPGSFALPPIQVRLLYVTLMSILSLRLINTESELFAMSTTGTEYPKLLLSVRFPISILSCALAKGGMFLNTTVPNNTGIALDTLS